MTARPESTVNRIANIVIRELGKIDSGTDAVKWHSRPREVRRGGPAMFTNVERPAFLVSVSGATGEFLSYPNHKETIQLDIWALIDPSVADSADEATEAILYRMLDDAIQAMAINEPLDGLVMFSGPPRRAIESDDGGRYGLGVGRVSYEITYEWAHGAP